MAPPIRFFVAVSATSLATWAVLVLLARVTAVPDPLSLSGLPITQGLLAIGFAGGLASGLAHHIHGVFGGRGPANAWLTRAATALLAASGFTLAASTLLHAPDFTARASAILLASGVALHLAAFIGVRMRQRHRPSPAPHAGTLAFALLGGAAGAHLGAAGIAGLALGTFAPPTIHLWNLGVLTLLVFAILHQVIPRFTRLRVPPSLHLAQALFVLPVPALVAYGAGQGQHVAIALAAVSLTLATGIMIAILLSSFLGRLNPQPFAGVLVAALALLAAGGLLGAYAAGHQDAARIIPVHAVNQLLGFLGLAILGMGDVMLGIGIVRFRAKPRRIIVALALAVAVPLLAWEAATVAGSPWAPKLGALLGVAALGLSAALARTLAPAVVGPTPLRRRATTAPGSPAPPSSRSP